MKILTSEEDDFLYNKLLDLLKEVKLVRGGTELAYTLRNHRVIRDYLKEKQTEKLKYYEDTFFTEDGLDQLAIESYLQSPNHSVY